MSSGWTAQTWNTINKLNALFGTDSASREDPEDLAVKFWAPLYDASKSDDSLFRLLCNSVYDYLRNTCEVPLQCMNPRKPYVNPEMFRYLENMFDVPFSSSIDRDFEYLDPNTSDLLLFAFYLAHEFDVDETSRPGCPGSKMPYITRSTLFLWIKMQIGLDPSRVHGKINALLTNATANLLDPRTDEPWKHIIPRSCFPEKPDPYVVSKQAPAVETLWEELRQDVLRKRRSEAVANGEPTRKQMMEIQRTRGWQGNQMHMMNQAGANSVHMSMATRNNIQNMSFAASGERMAAWSALQYESNLNYMGSGQF